jgi:hypothetical protein
LIDPIEGWVSPRLGIRFEIREGEDIRIFYPDGRPFATFLELANQRDAAELLAEAERQRAEAAEKQAARLIARLHELGVDPGTLS